MNSIQSRGFLILALSALLLAACAPKQAAAPTPELKLLTAAEADAIWAEATDIKPVGEAAVVKTEVEGGATVITTTQLFSMKRKGGGFGTMGASCSAGCQTKDGDFGNCVTSGCEPDHGSCTAFSCSGSCTLSHACKAGTSFGSFTTAVIQ